MLPKEIYSGMSIGQFAAAAGVNVETVRYYQRLRLLRVPPRAHGEITRYSSEDLKRLRFVKRAQHLGFALDEIRQLFELADGRHCAETQRLAERKLRAVRQKLADLNAMRTTLEGLINACSRTTDERGCPMIEALLN